MHIDHNGLTLKEWFDIQQGEDKDNAMVSIRKLAENAIISHKPIRIEVYAPKEAEDERQMLLPFQGASATIEL